MKKPSSLQRFKALPKRTKFIVLGAIVGLLGICCCGLPALFPSSEEGATKVADVDTAIPTITVVKIEPTKAVVPATAVMKVEPTKPIVPTSTVKVEPTSTHAPTATAAPTILPTEQATATESVPSFYVADCLPKNTPFQKGTVVKIIDGDTVDVRLEGGAVSRVRYIGIDTPELERPLYEEARGANSDLVLNKEVILIKDVSETDSFDRLLRYVIVGDVFVNLEMVKRGLAVAEDYPPDTACSSALSLAMNGSRSSEIGIWEATQTPEPSGPIVVIIYVNKKAEYVDIQNQGKSDVDLSGWNLVSETGNQECPLAGILKAGETLRIWSMAAEEPGYSCGFQSDIWNNSKSDPAVLYNPEGQEVSRR